MGPDPRRWGILAVVVVAQLMIVLDASIVTIALPSAQRALHISTADRQWVITAYTCAFGGLLPLGGRIADDSGRKRMFAVGLLGFAGASALGGLAVDHGVAASPAGVVHGFAVAFAVGAGLLTLGAVVSAVFVSAGPRDVSLEGAEALVAPATA